ncbi:hypothetical protein D3C75_1186740 [compost metagenome]
MGQLHFLAVFILDFGKLEIGIVQHAKNILRRLGQRADLREQRFFRLGQDMRLLPLHFGQRESVIRQGRVRDELIKLLVRQGQNFRRHIGEGFARINA